jgi:hypothetical protein
LFEIYLPGFISFKVLIEAFIESVQVLDASDTVQAALADLLAAHRVVCLKLKLEEDVTLQEKSRCYVVSREGPLTLRFLCLEARPRFQQHPANSPPAPSLLCTGIFLAARHMTHRESLGFRSFRCRSVDHKMHSVSRWTPSMGELQSWAMMGMLWKTVRCRSRRCSCSPQKILRDSSAARCLLSWTWQSSSGDKRSCHLVICST